MNIKKIWKTVGVLSAVCLMGAHAPRHESPDRDGVVVVPREVEAEVIGRALEKVQTESDVRQAILAGMSTVEAFERFGVM